MRLFFVHTCTRTEVRLVLAWLSACLAACSAGSEPDAAGPAAGGTSMSDAVSSTSGGTSMSDAASAATSATSGGTSASNAANGTNGTASTGAASTTAVTGAGSPTASSGSGGTSASSGGAEGATASTSASGGSGGSGADGAGGNSGGSGGGSTGSSTATPTSSTSTAASTTGGDPSCRGGSEPDFSLSGWATEAGGTSGGKGGQTITVSTGTELAQALEDKQDSSTPLTILVDGSITPANSGSLTKFDVKDVSDLSIIGTGAGAEFAGIGIKVVRASNIVLRNLKIFNVTIGDKDAISIEGPADHIWVDHCELHAEYQNVDKDYYDGLLDAKAEAEYITYSWNYLHDSWKTMLVGSSEDDTFDRKLTVHHNHFQNCNSRLPLFRGGNGHVFNNFFEDVVSTAINSRLGACLRVENNRFESVINPWISAYSDVLGGVDLVCNSVDDDSAFVREADDEHEPPNCSAVVPYTYDQVLNHVDHVADLVSTHAGVGKLSDPTDF